MFAQLGVIPEEAREEKRRSTKAKDTTRSFSVHLLIKEVYGEQASYWIRPGRGIVSTYHHHLLNIISNSVLLTPPTSHDEFLPLNTDMPCKALVFKTILTSVSP